MAYLKCKDCEFELDVTDQPEALWPDIIQRHWDQTHGPIALEKIARRIEAIEAELQVYRRELLKQIEAAGQQRRVKT